MATKRHYGIGYGKPPKHAQWKKGQSGNPKGRPRRDRNVSALVAALLAHTIRLSHFTARFRSVRNPSTLLCIIFR